MTNDFSFVKCPKCEHDRNPVTAQKCEICGTPLKKSGLPIAPIAIGVALAGILGAIGFVLKDMSPGSKPSTSINPTSNPTTNVAASPSAASSNAVPSASPSSSSSGNAQNAQVQGAVVQTYSKLSDVPNVPQGIFNYGGSTTFAPLRSPTILSQLNQAFPRYQLRYTEPPTGSPGSGKGIEQLIDGQMSLAQSSRPVRDAEYATAKNRGFTLDEVPVVIDGVAFFVNPQLIDKGLKGLNLVQLRDIFTGKIQNWKEVGGPDQKIAAFSRNLKSGGTVDFFSETVLEKQPLGTAVKEVRDTTDAIRRVASTLGGIGYASTSETIKQQTIRLLSIGKGSSQTYVSPCGDAACTSANDAAFKAGAYPITRRLFVVIRRDGKLDEQAGVAYANMLLSDEGQQLAKQAGFIPIR
jgi:phosphate transport system substrate-binding protein